MSSHELTKYMRSESNQDYVTEGGNDIHDIDLDPMKFKEEKQPLHQLKLLGVEVNDMAAGFRAKLDS